MHEVDELNLRETKFGCGAAKCGCVLPVSAATGKQIHTIESLSDDSSHPLLKAWIAERVPPCRFCQPGQIMAVAALFMKTPHPSDAEIDAATTYTCRCGTHDRIRAPIHRAAQDVSMNVDTR